MTATVLEAGSAIAESKRRSTILFVTSVYPHGPEYGAQQRVLNLLRILSRTGDVSVVFACPAPVDEKSVRETEKEFRVAHTAVVHAIPSLSLIDRVRFELDPGWINGNLTAISEEDRSTIEKL